MRNLFYYICDVLCHIKSPDGLHVQHKYDRLFSYFAVQVI